MRCTGLLLLASSRKGKCSTTLNSVRQPYMCYWEVLCIVSTIPCSGRCGEDVGDHPPITPMRLPAPDELSGADAQIFDYVIRHFFGTVCLPTEWIRCEHTIPFHYVQPCLVCSLCVRACVHVCVRVCVCVCVCMCVCVCVFDVPFVPPPGTFQEECVSI